MTSRIRHFLLLAAGAWACTAAAAGGPTLNVNVGVTFIPSSGVCGAASGTSSISVTCVAPPPPAGSGGGGSVATPGPSPSTPALPPGGAGGGTPLQPPAVPPGGSAGSGNPGGESVVTPSLPATPPGSAGSPPSPTGAAPGGTAESQPLPEARNATGGATSQVIFSQWLNLGQMTNDGNQTPVTLRKYLVLPTLVTGAMPISLYSQRADITGYRTVSNDNGSYVELTISW